MRQKQLRIVNTFHLALHFARNKHKQRITWWSETKKKIVKSIIIKFNGYCLAQKIRESQNYVLLSLLSHLTYIHFVYIKNIYFKRGEKMSDYCGKS